MSQLTRTLPLLLGIGLAAIAATVGMASSTGDALRCDIVEHSRSGMRIIEGRVSSPRFVAGDYRFAVKSQNRGNTATVSQGGAFAVPANEPVSVGQVQIDAGARYSLDFSITVGGQTIECTPGGARFT